MRSRRTTRGTSVPEDPTKYLPRRCRRCGVAKPRYLLRWLPGGKYECLSHPYERPPTCPSKVSYASPPESRA